MFALYNVHKYVILIQLSYYKDEMYGATYM